MKSVERQIKVLHATSRAFKMGLQGQRPFLHFKDKNDNSRAEISMAPDGVPSLTVYDEKGKLLADLIRAPHK